jgi:hypothetical protein
VGLLSCRHRRIGWPRRFPYLKGTIKGYLEGDWATCLDCGKLVEIEIFQEDFHEKASSNWWIIRFIEWLFC